MSCFSWEQSCELVCFDWLTEDRVSVGEVGPVCGWKCDTGALLLKQGRAVNSSHIHTNTPTHTQWHRRCVAALMFSCPYGWTLGCPELLLCFVCGENKKTVSQVRTLLFSSFSLNSSAAAALLTCRLSIERWRRCKNVQLILLALCRFLSWHGVPALGILPRFKAPNAPGMERHVLWNINVISYGCLEVLSDTCHLLVLLWSVIRYTWKKI